MPIVFIFFCETGVYVWYVLLLFCWSVYIISRLTCFTTWKDRNSEYADPRQCYNVNL